MTLTLRNVRDVTAIDSLSDLDRAQVFVAGKAFDGVDRSAEDRFRELPVPQEWIDEGCDWDDGRLDAFELWTAAVFDGETHLFDLWAHHVDAATLFAAGTAENVAGRVQFSWMDAGLSAPFARAAELDEAMRAIGRG